MFRPMHFEIHADQPERAVRFYSEVFGWLFSKWSGPQDYWLITTGAVDQPGINGGLMQRRDPGGATYNTVDVPSVDEFLIKITSHGGTIALPKMAIPGVGWLAYCKDTEGNIFGIHEADPSAK
ncbi:MAG: VOC family protein [Candidatus Zixiibacteriota bacterium]